MEWFHCRWLLLHILMEYSGPADWESRQERYGQPSGFFRSLPVQLGKVESSQQSQNP